MPRLDAENELEGNVGYLTFREFQRVTRAWENAYKHVAWWRVAGYVKLGDRDEHRTRSSELPLGVPATWLAAEEISRLMGELNGWATLEDAVNDQYGAELAMLFLREVETAMAKWPMEDRPHNVRFFRCTACQGMTLRYFPPTIRGGELLDVVVKCTDRECRAVMDGSMYERMAYMIKHEQELRDRARVARVGASGGSGGGGAPVGVHDLAVGSSGEGGDVAAGRNSVSADA